MTFDEIKSVTKSRLNSVTGKIEPDPNNSTSGRDICYSSNDFWTVRIVMASKYEKSSGDFDSGWFVPGANTILLFYETIEQGLKNEGLIDNNTDPLEKQFLLAKGIQQTLLHEIGHVFTLDDDNDISHDGVMRSPISVLHAMLPAFQKFLSDDLKEIQKSSKALN